MPSRLVPLGLLLLATLVCRWQSASAESKRMTQDIDLTQENQILPLQSLSARRVGVVQGMGYFPVVARLKDGTFAAVLRGAGAHIGVEGRLDLVFSKDEGETWSAPQKVVDGPEDDRNPAFGVASDGTLVLAYVILKGYQPGSSLARDKRFFDGVYVIRSKDQGKTWDPPTKLDKFPSGYVSPYGKIISLAGGSLMMTLYAKDDLFKAPLPAGSYSSYAYVARSHDGGKTWNDLSLIAAGYDEVGLLRTRDNKIVAAMRGNIGPDNVSIAISADNGKTWSKPQPITFKSEHPADMVQLGDGRIILAHGERNWPMGVQAMISHDGGITWNRKDKLMLSWLAPNTDTGYPSSWVRSDGKILTLYYQVDDVRKAPQSAACKAVIWDVPAEW